MRAFAPAVALLALALVVRLVLVAGTDHLAPTGDVAAYDEHASYIADHGRYPPSSLAPGGGPTAFRPPAYPYLVGAVYKVAGSEDGLRRVTAGRLLGVLLGVLTVALIGTIAALLWGRTPALYAMGISSVYPTLVAVGSSLLSEALFTPCVLAAVACVLIHRRSPGSYRWLVLAGLAVGLATLTRTNGLVLLPAVLVGVWTGAPRIRWRPAAALFASCAVVLLPWIGRNLAAFGEPIFTTQAGYTLAGTYNDVSRNDPVNPAAWRPAIGRPYAAVIGRRDLDEAEIDARLRSLSLSYMLDRPSYVAKVVIYNGLRMLEVTGRAREHVGARETGVGRVVSDAGRDVFWILIVLAGASLILLQQPRRVPHFLWMTPVLLIASLLPVNSSARYREPADPFLVLLAGLTLAVVVARLRSRHSRGQGVEQPEENPNALASGRSSSADAAAHAVRNEGASP